jgi:hypothetical protein
MSTEPREPRVQALEQLTALLTLLRGQPAVEQMAPLVELGEQLHRAIASFHMEAIRFRMYTLGRQLAQAGSLVPPEGLELYDGIRSSLEAAGFQTRSITS